MITEPPEIKYLYAKAGTEGIPLGGTLELTARCNLDCKMCYIHGQTINVSNELTTEQWLKIIDDAADNGCLFILLTGGEPFLRKDFKEIYLECIKRGIMVSINTNSTLIGDDEIEFLSKNAPLRINASLYGASAQTYQKLCGNGKMYDRVVSSILKMKKAGLPVKINFTISEFNSGDIAAVYKFAADNEIIIQPSTYTFKPVRKSDCDLCSFSRAVPQRSAEFTAMCTSCRYNNEDLLEHIKTVEDSVKKAAEEKKFKTAFRQNKPCRAGKSSFWISWEGDMMICGMMPSPSISVTENGFESSWAKVRERSKDISLPAECSVCEYRELCEICVASCISETGSTLKPPEYQCERAKSLYKELMKIKNEKRT